MSFKSVNLYYLIIIYSERFSITYWQRNENEVRKECGNKPGRNKVLFTFYEKIK